MQRFLFVFSFFNLSWLNFEIISDYNSYKNQTDKNRLKCSSIKRNIFQYINSDDLKNDSKEFHTN